MENRALIDGPPRLPADCADAPGSFRGWTQAMLADHAELTREHLSELEGGKKEIGIRSLERIIQTLDSSWSRFFEGF